MNIIAIAIIVLVLLYVLWLLFIIINVSDESYNEYRKLLLNPELDTDGGDTVKYLVRKHTGEVQVRTKVSIGATKRFLNQNN